MKRRRRLRRRDHALQVQTHFIGRVLTALGGKRSPKFVFNPAIKSTQSEQILNEIKAVLQTEGWTVRSSDEGLK